MQEKCTNSFIFMVLMSYMWHSYAQVPQFTLMNSSIKANNTPITTRFGFPTLVDWNRDGKNDLIVGEQVMVDASGVGKVRLYINEGTNKNPHFKNFEYMKADGTEISLAAG